MASDYGLNFGFLRSSEEVRVAEGRFRIPAGVAWMLGTCVQPDTTSPVGPAPLTTTPQERGELQQAPANAAPVTGYCGLLLQELEWMRSIYESDVGLMDSFQYGVAKPANLAIITNGAGTKVWFKNTLLQNPRADGRVIPAKTMFSTTNVDVGAELGWDGTVWAEAATGKHMKVTAYTPAIAGVHGGYVEAVLLA
jgi:hypothetical protein